MELKYSDDVKLQINITEKMKQDYRECGECARVAGGDGRSCDGCSLDVDIEGLGLCEIPLVTEKLEVSV